MRYTDRTKFVLVGTIELRGLAFSKGTGSLPSLEVLLWSDDFGACSREFVFTSKVKNEGGDFLEQLYFVESNDRR